jgi:hypothetical protein
MMSANHFTNDFDFDFVQPCRYCSKECQALDWKVHLPYCRVFARDVANITCSSCIRFTDTSVALGINDGLDWRGGPDTTADTVDWTARPTFLYLMDDISEEKLARHVPFRGICMRADTTVFLLRVLPCTLPEVFDAEGTSAPAPCGVPLRVRLRMMREVLHGAPPSCPVVELVAFDLAGTRNGAQVVAERCMGCGAVQRPKCPSAITCGSCCFARFCSAACAASAATAEAVSLRMDVSMAGRVVIRLLAYRRHDAAACRAMAACATASGRPGRSSSYAEYQSPVVGYSCSSSVLVPWGF